jgi:Ni,Fe-hydrogenase III large subunit
MNWLITKNNKVIKLSDIPELSIDEFRVNIIKECKDDRRVVSFFGVKKEDKIILYAVLANDEHSSLLISSTSFKSEKSYDSITQEIPSFYLFEREFYEQFGIEPLNHPWLKPVRYDFRRFDKSRTIENYPFFKMEGGEIHEVAVGPIHAGIIEPGHFRFMCDGENVNHLEIQLGYQHRGVENLFLQGSILRKSHLAEEIAGDSSIAHNTAYSSAIESLAEIEISKRAMAIRAIALELERIATHLYSLSGIANDVAYLPASSAYGATRTLVINTSLAICGSRFGRGLIRPGGVVFDIDEKLISKIKDNLKKVEDNVELISETMFNSPSVLSRLEKTGIVNQETAKRIGLVGISARASGFKIDVRADHPVGAYRYFPIYKIVLEGGDVFARAYIRYIEIKQSINFINEQLKNISGNGSLFQKVEKFSPDSFVLSIVEGHRGEIVHTALTDNSGNVFRYKIKDPSFNNWFGLALAVRNNGISDFPLCNKSFDLSYAGFDL